MLLFVIAAHTCSSLANAFLHPSTWVCSFGSTQLQRRNFNLKWHDGIGVNSRIPSSGPFLFSSALDDGNSGEQIYPTSYIVSYDGAIANTARARCRLCLGVALRCWPSLCDRVGVESTNEAAIDNIEQWTWVLNKMEALVPAMSNDGTNVGGLSVMVDLVMLARLVLEEQRLDDGRNSGRGGKYGGKYHPQQKEEQMALSDADSSKPVGSRPLTVGEMGANWLDGGHLRDTVRVKYAIDKKDPFPIIQEHVEIALENADDDLKINRTSQMMPGANLQLLSLIKRSDDSVILLDHESRTNEAYQFLKDAGSMPLKTIAPSGDDSELDVLKSLVLKTDEGDSPKRICIIHHSLSLLQRLKMLFGGDSPRLRGGYAQIPNKSIEIGLFLPAWSDCTSPQQENDGLMDPWLNVLTEDDLSRMLEAQDAINAWE